MNSNAKAKEVNMSPFINKDIFETKPSSSKNWFRNLSLYFSEYCDSTSIHGIKYVGQRGRYLLEKLLWTIIIIFVCSICIVLIHKTYKKWITSPVIVTFSTTEMPISDIPFPAVTICPEVKFNPEIFNFTDYVIKTLRQENISDDESSFFNTLAMCCSTISDFSDIIGLSNNNKTMDDYMMALYFMAIPDPNPVGTTTLKWLGKTLDLNQTLQQTFTSDGICYTFNMLPYDELLRDVDDYISTNTKTTNKMREWSLDKGYPSKHDLDSYPRRTSLPGVNGGLEIDALFTNDNHLDFLCDQSLQGFKVTLHHPCELPNMEKHFILPLDQAVNVGVKPKMITISDDLISYKPKDRKCYFTNEKYLSMYKQYTQENCLSECLANFTMNKCGCVAFYMPSTSKTQICGLGSYDCIKKSKIKFIEAESISNLEVGRCGCLPSCNSLTYEMETSQTNWNWKKMFEVFHNANLSQYLPSATESHFSRINVYYNDLQFLASERNELYGYVDFFSNVGGLLGLFIGFSVTSAIEILYYLTLRILCNIKKYGNNVWCGDPELLQNKDG